MAGTDATPQAAPAPLSAPDPLQAIGLSEAAPNGNGKPTARQQAEAVAAEVAKKHNLDGPRAPFEGAVGFKAPEEIEVEGEPAAEVEEVEDTPAEVEAEADETPETPEDETPSADAGEASPRLGIRVLTDPQMIALRRAQIDDETIAELSDAALIRLADRCAANERRNKEHFESLKGQQPKRTEGRQRQEAEGEAPATSPVSPEPAPQAPRSLPQPVRDALGLDDAEVKPLVDWHQDGIAEAERRVTAAAERRVAQAEATVREAREEAQKLRGLVEQQMAQSIRADLKALWPEIAAPDVWSKVYAKAIAISPGYASNDLGGSMRQLLRDAAHLVIGAPRDEAKPLRGAKAAPKGAGNAAASAEPAKNGAETPPRRTRALTPKELTERNAKEALRKHGLSEAGRRRW